jgi:RNA polymerase sigma-70 factor (ECF subfamily)
MIRLDEQIRSLLAVGDLHGATTLALTELGPEILGFLSGVLGISDADDVFSIFSERLWRSLNGFEGRCSLRTWAYVVARREIGRFLRGARKHASGHVPISGLQEVLEAVRTRTRSTLVAERQQTLTRLRDELPIEDRTILILRVDRNLSWDEIALAFAADPEAFGEEERKRESARLRKRFELIKRRLVARAREVHAG